MGIRVPRIKIQAELEEGAHLGDLSILSVGYGLHQAWVFATMFGGASIFGISTHDTGVYGIYITPLFVISIVVYIACLLFASRTDQRFLRIYASRKTLIPAALVCCFGTAVAAIGASSDSAVVYAVSGVCTGAGSALLILAWGTAFARLDPSSIVLNSSLAIPIGMAAYTILLHSFPVPLSGVITSIIPLLELAVLWSKTPLLYSQRNEVPIFKPLPINRGKFFMRFSTPTLVLGFALGLLRLTSIQSCLPASTFGDQILILLASGCATVLILIGIAAQGRGDLWNRIFRPLVPFIAVTLLFFPASQSESDVVAKLALLIGYLCFEALMWIFFGVISQRFRLSPVMVFGLGRGMLALGILAGSLMPFLASAWFGNALQEEGMIGIMMVVIVVAYALLPREREIEDIVIPCPAVRAVTSHLEDSLTTRIPAHEEESHESSCKPIDTAQQAENARQNMLGAQDCAHPVAPQNTEVYQQFHEQTDQEYQHEKDLVQKATDRDVLHTSSSASKPSASRLAAISIQPSTGGAETQRHPARFRAKCETIANTFLLSNRETEVLFFLAKGHNAAYIQEKLYISEGTAKTHIRHIYRKLDVHTQQDLMRMVESADEFR